MAATARPAPVEPVRVTAATRSSVMTRLLTAGVWSNPATITASGTPAAAASSSSRNAQPVVEGACLSTTTFPAATAGASARTTCQQGKFHGMIANRTPSGT
jgi:hypothetical protein